MATVYVVISRPLKVRFCASKFHVRVSACDFAKLVGLVGLLAKLRIHARGSDTES